MSAGRRAIFLDRDGVLIRDVDLLVEEKDIEIFPGVAEALRKLSDLGYLLLVVSNQTVVSRGLATEEEVALLNKRLNSLLGGVIDKFYICPHHPQATLPEYRVVCNCRKPDNGMLLAAQAEFDLALGQCWMIGDRVSDIVAGRSCGCRTVLLTTGAHVQKPIISDKMPQKLPEADYVCPGLPQAAEIIGRFKDCRDLKV